MLKIIHAVTDDGVKIATESIELVSSNFSLMILALSCET